MKALGQSLYPHSQNRHVTLEYYPIRNIHGAIAEVVVVATDKTSEFEAQKALEAERQYAGMIVKYTKNKDQFLQFLASVRESLNGLEASATKILNGEQMNESFRLLHTIEGEAGTFSLGELRRASRVSQQVLEPFKGKSEISESGRAEFARSLAAMREQFMAFLNENEDLFKVPEGEVERSVEVPMTTVNSFLSELRQAKAARGWLEFSRSNS